MELTVQEWLFYTLTGLEQLIKSFTGHSAYVN